MQTTPQDISDGQGTICIETQPGDATSVVLPIPSINIESSRSLLLMKQWPSEQTWTGNRRVPQFFPARNGTTDRVSDRAPPLTSFDPEMAKHGGD
jgi:hypothetical protein